MPVGMLVDTTKCIGCRNCEINCHKYYNLPDIRLAGTDASPELDAYHYNVVKFYQVNTGSITKNISIHKQCFHCSNPACMSVCPVGALHKTENGSVIWNEGKCIGCRYCQNACPFDIPKFEWNVGWEGLTGGPKIAKCIFCYELVTTQNTTTICNQVCPTKAILFGERDDMIAEAHDRISANPDRYYNYVYGEQEVGGTALLYINAVSPDQLGLPTTKNQFYPEYTHEFLSRIPLEISAIAIVLSGIYIFRSRRMASKAENSSGGKD